MKKHLSTIFIGLILFIGLSVLLYPTISDIWNQMNATRAIADYKGAVNQLSQEEIDEMFSRAQEYNKRLAENPQAFYDPDIVSGYEDALDITGTGIMGYLTIDKIDVELPIYHTMDEGVLQIAVGHMPGTSFPIGGSSTHAVMSGHRGLPSATLLSDLDKMEAGDTFSVNILNKKFTYQVDQIRIVLPEETEELQIVPGKEYATLFTCTPYGINSHRMLVRGVRIENIPSNVKVTNEANNIDLAMAVVSIGVPMLTATLLVFVFRNHIRRKQYEAQMAAMDAMGLNNDKGGRQ